MNARPLPGNLKTNPSLGRWVHMRPEGYVEVTSGKVEIGQGILTALAQIAADELDVGFERIRMIPASTGYSPNEAVTSGSLSIEDSGTALRQACAEARAIYLALAAERLGVPAHELTVSDGTIAGPGNLATSYWELADDRWLAREALGTQAPKPAGARRIAGQSLARLDIPDKVFGRPRFMHDLAWPDMLHGRVLRPPAPGAKLLALATSLELPGVVKVVREGSFAGVVARSETEARSALVRLAKQATWSEGFSLPDESDLAGWLKSQPVETTLVAERAAREPRPCARTVRRTYTRPFIAHASAAPSCALARFKDGKIALATHSQGIYNLRADLAIALACEPSDIVIEHHEGAGCYGHNGADDVAFDAVLLARAVPGRSVRVQWSRADELTWAPMGAAMAVDVEADLDAAGEILAWRQDVWSNGHVARPGRNRVPALLAASQLAKPFERLLAGNPPLAGGGGAERNAVPLYDFPALRVASHRVLTMPIRTSALRTLGAFANVFAIESFLDELVAERGEDPLAARLRRLGDARARAVLEAAAARAGWRQRRKAEGVGHGLALARYKNAGAWCAAIAEVEIATEVRVRRLVLGVDVGEVINPDGLANQIEGGAIQAVSWALKEAVRFDRTRITSDSWETYPILRFSEVPHVEVEIVTRAEEKPLGAGEAALGPVGAAIANAVFDGVGARVRDVPITRDRIIAAMP